MPRQRAAVVLLTNDGAGRALYRPLFADLMRSAFGVDLPPLQLDPAPAVPGDLARFAGTYAWPDRRIDVTATGDSLRIAGEEIDALAAPIDDRTFLVDAADPDAPTVTFGSFDAEGRPGVLYDVLWGLPRIGP
jgi:hypothetical protein